MKTPLMKPIVLALALSAAAFEAVDAQSDSTASFKPYPPLNMSEGEFIAKTISDNKREINLAELAIQKSENENVKAIAEMLVEDHNRMNKKLNGIAEGMEQSDDSENNNSVSEQPSKTNSQGNEENSQQTAVNDGKSLPGDTGTASNQLDIAGTKTTRDMDSSTQQSNRIPTTDPMAILENANGAEFDRIWIEQMLIKHKIKLGQLHEARKTYDDPKLKNVVTSAIPVIREHRDMLAAVKDNPEEPIKIKHSNKANDNRNARLDGPVRKGANNDAASR